MYLDNAVFVVVVLARTLTWNGTFYNAMRGTEREGPMKMEEEGRAHLRRPRGLDRARDTTKSRPRRVLRPYTYTLVG